MYKFNYVLVLCLLSVGYLKATTPSSHAGTKDLIYVDEEGSGGATTPGTAVHKVDTVEGSGKGPDDEDTVEGSGTTALPESTAEPEPEPSKPEPTPEVTTTMPPTKPKPPTTMPTTTGHTDDEDLVEGSGKTSTSAEPEPKTTAEPVVTHMTNCQRIRHNVLSRGLLGAFYPRCKVNGEFEELQCHGSVGYCWCVDDGGREVKGSRIRGKADCTKKLAEKTKCQRMRDEVLSRGLLGSFIPHCTEFGEYEHKQCHGSVGHCWCVNEDGEEILNTRTRSADLDCANYFGNSVHPVRTQKPTPEAEKRTTTEELDNDINFGSQPSKDPTYTVDNNVIPGAQKPTTGKVEVQPDPDNSLSDAMVGAKKDSSLGNNTFLGTGQLAAVIGGAIIGLLCAILLVMFIVYRMRKKDEGSYALDEPKSPALNAYTKNTNREFYA